MKKKFVIRLAVFGMLFLFLLINYVYGCMWIRASVRQFTASVGQGISGTHTPAQSTVERSLLGGKVTVTALQNEMNGDWRATYSEKRYLYLIPGERIEKIEKYIEEQESQQIGAR
jgi:hypothetical protein